MTKADLEHLWHLNRAIARDLERLHELQSALSGRTSSISGLPHTGILKDNTGLYVAIIDELKQAIMERVLDSILEYAKLNAFINDITDPLLRQILLYRYVDNLQWPQIAARIGGDNTAGSVRKIVDRYLNSLAAKTQ